VNRDACNRRWRQLVESGDVTVQLSDGQLTLLWSEIRQGRREFYAWRSVATLREYRPEAPTTSPRAFDRLWR